MAKVLNYLFFSATSIASAAHANAASYAPKQVDNPTQICVERFEDTGIVNLIPVTTTLNGSSQLRLIGGEAGCLFVYAGPQSISLTFPNPSNLTNLQYWTTPMQLFTTKGGELVSFELCEAIQDHNDPRWPAIGWHAMWLLRRADDGSAPKCADEISP